MFKIIVFTASLFLLSGCLGLTPDKPAPVIKSSKKIFDHEDTYILFALRAEQVHEYAAAASMFNTLYEKTNKKEYLYRSLENDIHAEKYAEVVTKVDEVLNGTSVDDYTLLRMKIIALIQLHKLEEAKELALGLVEKSKMADDYILLSDIYVKQKKFNMAIKYLESAYTQNYNEKILDRMAIILYVNLQRKKDAIAQLETHSRVHGCSQLICSRLAGFYSNDNNIDGLLSVYLRLYALDKNDDIAQKIIQIYAYKKEYVKLMDFLEENTYDDTLLLQLYIKAKKYKEASLLAEKIYKESGEIDYLGQSAIFEYEAASDKENKELQNSVLEKLKKVVKVDDATPLYFNYLGYLLIDHEIDIKGGMKYIRKALQIEPNSAYYLDSLAWGYYKLGDCTKADEILKKVVTLKGGSDDEVVAHIKEVAKCLHTKTKKGKEKK